jgi:hypothetical protein
MNTNCSRAVPFWSAVACHRFRKREQAPALQESTHRKGGNPIRPFALFAFSAVNFPSSS